MTSPTGRHAGLYLRISEDREDDRLAVTRQREDGEELIRRRGWELVDSYVDNDISAKRSGRRKEFDRLMRDVEAGHIDAIVVTEMTRLSRNRRDDLRIVETCQPRGVIIAVVRGSDIDMSTAAGRLTADVLASVARHEIEVKAERQRRQIRQAAEAGRPHGAPRAFGYRPDGLRVHPVEAPVVVEMFTRWLSGARLSEIAAWLREIGVKTPRGNAFTPESVKVVLRNPRYAGIRGTRRAINGETGQRELWWTEIAPATWPGIVSEETWRAALTRLRSAMYPEYHRGGQGPIHLLSGIALCARCGSVLVSGVTGGSSPVRTYRCRERRGHLTRVAEPLEHYVQWQTWLWLARPKALELLAPRPAGVDVAAAQAELAATRERRRQLATAFAARAIDYDQLVIGTRDARVREAELEAQIAAAGQVDVLAPLVGHPVDRVAEHWLSSPMSTRRAALSRIFHVLVLRGRVGRPPRSQPFDPTTVILLRNIPRSD